jgi:hypothetical protein
VALGVERERKLIALRRRRCRGGGIRRRTGDPRDVTAQSLELSPVAAVDDLLGVHVTVRLEADRARGSHVVA